MVLIPPGEFLMGSSEEQLKQFVTEAGDDRREVTEILSEGPQHLVRITNPFWLARHEVTRGNFGTFVKETQYLTEAEKDGLGCWGHVDDKWCQDPRFIYSACRITVSIWFFLPLRCTGCRKSPAISATMCIWWEPVARNMKPLPSKLVMTGKLSCCAAPGR